MVGRLSQEEQGYLRGKAIEQSIRCTGQGVRYTEIETAQNLCVKV